MTENIIYYSICFFFSLLGLGVTWSNRFDYAGLKSFTVLIVVILALVINLYKPECFSFLDAKYIWSWVGEAHSLEGRVRAVIAIGIFMGSAAYVVVIEHLLLATHKRITNKGIGRYNCSRFREAQSLQLDVYLSEIKNGTQAMNNFKNFILLILVVLLASCASQTRLPESVVKDVNSLQNEYFPIEPLIAKSQVEIPVNGLMVTKDIRALTNAQKLAYLGDTRVVITLAKETTSGELSYLTGKVTGEKGKYIAFMDYANFFIDDLSDGTNVIGRARVGVGLRLVARIQTKKKGIDLGSILKIGFAANKSQLSGELEVRAIGVTSKEIQSLLPGSLPNLDESSIQRALEAMAAVKTKIYDASTSVQPRIMSVALNSKNMVESAGVKPDAG